MSTRDELRDRIAEAAMRLGHPRWDADDLAAAVLAVLPAPADRAAILRKAAGAYEREQFEANPGVLYGAARRMRAIDVGNWLRRRADEAQPAERDEALCLDAQLHIGHTPHTMGGTRHCPGYSPAAEGLECACDPAPHRESDGTYSHWAGCPVAYFEQQADEAQQQQQQPETKAATEPQEPPAPADGDELRKRIAHAIHRYDNQHCLSGNDIPSKHHYGEADAVLAELPAPADQAAALSDAERTMLAYALDQAQERIWSEDGFTDEDQAAVTSLRRMADEAQPTGECGAQLVPRTGTRPCVLPAGHDGTHHQDKHANRWTDANSAYWDN